MLRVTESSIYWFFTGIIMILPHLLCSLVLPKRDHTFIRYISGIIMCLVVAFIDPMLPMSFASIWAVHTAGIVFLIWCSRVNLRMAVYYNVWSIVLYFISEQLAAVLASLLNSYEVLPVMYMTKSVAAILIGVIEIWLVKSIRSKGVEEFSWKQIFLSLLISVSLILVNVVNYRSDEGRSLHLFLFQLFSMFVVALTLYMQAVVSYSNQKRNDAEFFRFLWRANKKDYEMKREYVNLINHKYHDLKHEIRALQQMNAEDRSLHLSKLEREINQYHNLYRTGNEALDTMLNDKRRECENRDIVLTCIANPGNIDFIDLVDFYIMLGNLIDNAIEAVFALEKKQRIIDLKIYSDNGFLRIQIMNFFSGSLRYSADGLVSSKSTDGYHGYGTKSIRYIVNKYCGEVTMDAENKVFKVNIMIPMPR